MSFEEAKDVVAKKNGYLNWEEFEVAQVREDNEQRTTWTWVLESKHWDEAAELYCLEEKRSLCVLHGHSMFSVYNLSNRDRGGQSDWGLNKCSRCGHEEPWQYDF